MDSENIADDNLALTTYPEEQNQEPTPFNGELLPEYYFKDCHWGQSLELLIYLCLYTKKFILVTGQTGIGKTTLIKTFLKEVNDKFKICAISASIEMDVPLLMRRIACGFGLDWDENQNNSALFSNKQESTNDYEKNTDWILIIDNAELMANKVLANLLKLVIAQQKNNCSLRIILFSTPNLEKKLNSELFENFIAERLHVINIEPLSYEETKNYIYQQSQLFEQDFTKLLQKRNINRIYESSGGILKDINKLAKLSLEESNIKVINNMNKQSSKLPMIVTLSTIMICLLLAPFIISKVLTSSKSNLPTTKQLYGLKKVTPPKKVIPKNTAKVKKSNTPDNVIISKAKSNKPVSKKNTELEKIIILAGNNNKTDVDLEKMTKKQSVSNTTKPKNISSDTKITPSKNHKKNILRTKAENKLLAISTKHYTLQVLSGKSKAGIKNFIEQHPRIKHKASYYKTKRDGKDWYVLVYGDFSSKKDALKAMDYLKYTMKKLQPWMRSYASVHKAILNGAT